MTFHFLKLNSKFTYRTNHIKWQALVKNTPFLIANGLSLIFILLLLVTLIAQAFTGWKEHNGDVDPWCRNFYNQLIKRYFPNAQILIQHNKGHAPGYTADAVDYAKLTVANRIIVVFLVK